MSEKPNILIIYPHWPPSNLAGVHRARLIGNFLPDLGWHPIVLTVDPEFYEEIPDPDLVKTVDERLEVIYAKALKVRKPHIVGDIGLRAMKYLYREAKQIINKRKVDFIWIPIPSFYTALLGRMLYAKCKIPYGIDYIDPWVRDISNRKNIRALLSQLLARMLEPIAVKKAALISGVARKYYEPVLQRNFKHKSVENCAMPYGFDPRDHEVSLQNIDLPWKANEKVILYAGAFLPNSHLFVKALFRQTAELLKRGEWPENAKFYFIGTGNYAHKSILEYAREAGVINYVAEFRNRFPFLHILHFLNRAWRVCIIGSTEAHYTASKTFQVLLSQRPVFAVFHHLSSACVVMEKCKANDYLIKYYPENEDKIQEKIMNNLAEFIKPDAYWNPCLDALKPYSAYASAQKLVNSINKVIDTNIE